MSSKQGYEIQPDGSIRYLEEPDEALREKAEAEAAKLRDEQVARETGTLVEETSKNNKAVKESESLADG